MSDDPAERPKVQWSVEPEPDDEGIPLITVTVYGLCCQSSQPDKQLLSSCYTWASWWLDDMSAWREYFICGLQRTIAEMRQLAEAEGQPITAWRIDYREPGWHIMYKRKDDQCRDVDILPHVQEVWALVAKPRPVP